MNFKAALKYLVFAASVLVLPGCSNPIKSYYAVAEHALDTRYGTLGDNGLYHDVLYSPEAVNLNFEGFVVGIDKSPRALIGADSKAGALAGVFRESEQNGVARAIERLVQEPKTHYVSHIVGYAGKPYGDGNCFLHSIYAYAPFKPEGSEKSSPEKLSPLIEACDKKTTTEDPKDAFFGSFAAIDDFAAHIATRIKDGAGYSHVVFVVMGWNTPQIEAMRNFNSIAANIRHAANKANSFKPLFIGITWSSYWDQTWFDALVRLASYPNKANDADEVGASWLGYLIARVSAATPAIPKVAIGHSFGARALSMAVCMGPQFNMAHVGQAAGTPVKVDPVDVFVALQPAVSINRFLRDGGADKITYPESCNGAKRIVMTASADDDAVRSAVWADMAGADKARDEVCREKMDKFHSRSARCVRAGADGMVSPASESITERFVYVDASELVYFHHPNTGGGAHSDIYRPEMGRFVWQWFPRR